MGELSTNSKVFGAWAVWGGGRGGRGKGVPWDPKGVVQYTEGLSIQARDNQG